MNWDESLGSDHSFGRDYILYARDWDCPGPRGTQWISEGYPPVQSIVAGIKQYSVTDEVEKHDSKVGRIERETKDFMASQMQFLAR